MKNDYLTEDGHCWDIEDLTNFVQFKVRELLKLNYPNDEVIGFDDNEKWKMIASHILTTLKQNI